MPEHITAERRSGHLRPRPPRVAHIACGHGRSVSERYVTQHEAARLSGCSKDTIARARRAGRFPGARFGERQWTIPLIDLISAGLYHPPNLDRRQPGPGDTSVGEPAELVSLEVAVARIAALQEVVARQDDELRFLRQTVEVLARRGDG